MTVMNPTALITAVNAKTDINPFKFLDLIKHHIDLGDYDVFSGTQIRIEMFNSGLAIRLKNPEIAQNLEVKLLDLLEDEGYSGVRVYSDCMSNGSRGEIHYVRVLLATKSVRVRLSSSHSAAANALRNI